MNAATGLFGKAKERVAELDKTVDEAEADLAARRLEFAEVYARSGKANYMAFNYQQSADDYEQAYEQARRWDDWAAWSYRGNQAVALQSLGWRGGHTEKLMEALDLARDIVRMAEDLPDRSDLALSQLFLGNTLMTAGQRLDDLDLLRESIDVYEAAMPVFDETGMIHSSSLQDVMYNLAGAMSQLAKRRNDEALLKDAVDRFASLVERTSRTEEPAVWARTVRAQATAMTDLAAIDRDGDLTREAIRLLEESLAAYGREDDLDQWVDTMQALGNAQSNLGIFEGDLDAYRTADRTYTEILAAADKDTMPTDYAAALSSRALNAHHAAVKDENGHWFDQALADLDAVLEIYTRERFPNDWRDSWISIGALYRDVGYRRRDADLVHKGLQTHHATLAKLDRAADPVQWARVASMAADSKRVEGELRADNMMISSAMDDLEQAVAVMPADGGREAERVFERVTFLADTVARFATGDADRAPLVALARRAEAVLVGRKAAYLLAKTRSTLGRTLYSAATSAKDADLMAESVAAYRAALVPEARDNPNPIWANVQGNLGLALDQLAAMTGDAAFRLQAVDAWREAQPLETGEETWLKNQKRLAEALDRIGTADSLREAADAWRARAARLPGDDKAGRGADIDRAGRSLHNLWALNLPQSPAARDDAVAAYREALDLLAAAGKPVALTQENLADLVWSIGRAANDPVRLGEAADLYGAAADAVDPDRDAAMLKRVRAKHAGALLSGYFAGAGDAALDNAIAAFRLVFGPDAAATALENRSAAAEFAGALRYAAQIRSDEAMVREAVAIFDRLVEEPDAAARETDIAWAQVNAADAHAALGNMTGNAEELRTAVGLYREAMPAYLDGSVGIDWRAPYASLAASLLSLGDKTGDAETFTEAAAAYDRVIGATDFDTAPQQWSDFANGFAYATARRARAGAAVNPDALARAEDIVRRALGYYEEKLPDTAPYASDTLCAVLIEHGRATGDRALVDAGLANCERARKAFEAFGGPLLEATLATIAHGEKVMAGL
ncbi:MAG: hypothetical protein H6893_12535 [Brucellaceae bacterium]|nr:hypothetical protein [Brucellaceae bacterium]